MKKIVILILCLLLAGGAVAKVQYDSAVNSPLRVNEDLKCVVKGGDTFYSVLESLEKDGVISNTYLIKYYIKKNNIKTDIKPGKYIISKDVSLEELIEVLSKGSINENEVSVTIQEGKNIEEIGEILEQNAVISKEEFIKSCKNYELPDFIKKDDSRRYDLEGFLFPDTYIFNKNTSGDKIIETMIDRFKEIIYIIEQQNNIKIDNVDKIVTIASIIEKEVSVPEERGKVASVIYNRLEKDMMIQCDPTVVYALGKAYKEKVFLKDLKVDSPYNTYKIKGLPIGPICSPGKKSIEAAVMPAKTDYIYFVASNDGTHFFTDDYEEFLKVKAKTQGN
jgi:UPF0755 protein